MPNKNICLDIETLSTRSTAVIVSIAAVSFSFTSDVTEEFEVHINPRSSKDYGLHVDQKTLDWWKNSNIEAAKVWMNSKIDLMTGIQSFIDFTGSDKDTLWFSQGSTFDFPILQSSMQVLNIEPPWKFWNVRDMRTINWLGQVDPRNEPRVGLYHDALSDCYTQIQNMKKALGIKKSA